MKKRCNSKRDLESKSMQFEEGKGQGQVGSAFFVSEEYFLKQRFSNLATTNTIFLMLISEQ